MDDLLKNKVFFIAGAGGLLGSKLATKVLSQGARVIAADINVDSMKLRIENQGCDINAEAISFHMLNVTDESDVKQFFAQLDDNVDGAVNATYPRNATYGKHFFDVSLESFNENLSLHLGSAFLFSQQVASYFQRNTREFSLVNISSIYGVVAPKFDIYENTPMTMPVEYAAIKAAIQHLNKYIVAYVGDSQFRVNSVSPGGIFDHQPESFLQAYKKKTHGAGMLDVDDVIGAVLFLLSEQSKYITGQNIVIDDGFSL